MGKATQSTRNSFLLLSAGRLLFLRGSSLLQASLIGHQTTDKNTLTQPSCTLNVWRMMVQSQPLHDNNEAYLKVKTNMGLVKPHKAPEGNFWVFTSKYNNMSIELASG